jgi:hypothetical protein
MRSERDSRPVVRYTLAKNGVRWQASFETPDACWRHHFGRYHFNLADIGRMMDLGYEVVETKWGRDNHAS